MTVRIEAAAEATPELRDALAVLLPQLNPSLPIPSVEHLAAVVADPAVTLLLARDGPLIVGIAAVVVYTTPIWLKARIEDVVVDQAARGRGVGEALVKECIEVARRSGAGIVELQSARSREAADPLSATGIRPPRQQRLPAEPQLAEQLLQPRHGVGQGAECGINRFCR